MKNKYRIVRDGYCGYEAQVKRWWFPFWIQIGDPIVTNTSTTIEGAELVIDRHRGNNIVKYV